MSANNVLKKTNSLKVFQIWFLCYSHAGTVGFCSEAKGLLHGAHSRKAEIRPFPPGHVSTYEIDSQGKVSLLSTNRYLTIDGSYPGNELTLSACRHTNVRVLLKEAVKKRLMANRRIGCLLSGGLDSSLICGLVVECVRENESGYTCSDAP